MKCREVVEGVEDGDGQGRSQSYEEISLIVE